MCAFRSKAVSIEPAMPKYNLQVEDFIRKYYSTIHHQRIKFVIPLSQNVSGWKISLISRKLTKRILNNKLDATKLGHFAKVFQSFQVPKHTNLRKVEWEPSTFPSGSSDDRSPTFSPCPEVQNFSSSLRSPCRTWPSSLTMNSKLLLRIPARCGLRLLEIEKYPW